MNALLTACLLAAQMTSQLGGGAPPSSAPPGSPAVETIDNPRTRLYIRTIPAGAQVTLDGRPLGASDGLFLVPPGVGKLSVKFDGAAPRVEQIDIPEGKITRIELELQSPGNANRGTSPPLIPAPGHGGGAPGAGGIGLGGGGFGGGGFVGGLPAYAGMGGLVGVGGVAANSPGFKLVELRVKQPKTAPPVSPNALEQALSKTCDLDFVDSPLKDVCDFLMESNQVDVRLDPRGLEQAGINADTPVTLNLKGVRLSSALQTLADSVSLVWTIREDGIVLTSSELADASLINRVYDVSDLTNDFQGLIALIQFGPTEGTWTPNGGLGRIEADPADSEESLVVAQSETVHRQIGELLNLLRMARVGGIGTTPAIAHRGYWSQTEGAAKVRTALDTAVQADFVDAPVKDVLDFLASQTGCAIHLNSRSLENHGLSGDSPVTYSTKGKRLSTVLQTILEPLQLKFELESDFLQIVASDEQRLSIAVYPVQELVTQGRTVGQIARLVEQTTATGSWLDSDGGPADIYGVDGHTQCLVVSQTTAGHREIASLLGRLRKPRK